MLPVLSVMVALSAAQTLPPWMTGQSQPEDLSVTLVTFGPGDDLISWWGHTALVVEDRRLGHGRLYNYGMFSFDEGFFGRFAQGRLEFWVSDDYSIGSTFSFYQREQRDVRLQELNLLPDQAARIAGALGENVLPQNRKYLYHHYRDNCSTRPRDLIDMAVGGQLKAATSGPGRMTLRQHTLRYSEVNPPVAVALDFLQNDELDQPITQAAEAYLPDELERQVQGLVVTRPDGSRAPLVKRQRDLFKSRRLPPPEHAPNWTPWLLLIGLSVGLGGVGLGALASGGRRWSRVTLGVFTALFGLGPGLLGTALFIMGALTNQSVTYRNENLFFANPLTLGLLPCGVLLAVGQRRAPRALWWIGTALSGLSVLGVLLKALPMFDQANWNIIALLLPINLGFAAAAWRYQTSRRVVPVLAAPTT